MMVEREDGVVWIIECLRGGRWIATQEAYSVAEVAADNVYVKKLNPEETRVIKYYRGTKRDGDE